MDRATIAGEAGNAALKYAPIPGFLWMGSVSPVIFVQLALYAIGIVYGVMQISHLRWVWRNERQDRAAHKHRPKLPKLGSRVESDELPEVHHHG